MQTTKGCFNEQLLSKALHQQHWLHVGLARAGLRSDEPFPTSHCLKGVAGRSGARSVQQEGRMAARVARGLINTSLPFVIPQTICCALCNVSSWSSLPCLLTSPPPCCWGWAISVLVNAACGSATSAHFFFFNQPPQRTLGRGENSTHTHWSVEPQTHLQTSWDFLKESRWNTLVSATFT